MVRASRTAAAAIVALGWGISTLAWAQATPNFAGTWSLMEPRETRGKPVGGPDGPIAAGGQDGFHPTVIIKQSATELSVDGRTYHQFPDVHVYKLDGSELNYDSPSGKVVARTAWEGGKLTISAKRTFGTPVGDMTVQTKDTYSLVDGVLNIERDETTLAGRTRKLARYSRAKS